MCDLLVNKGWHPTQINFTSIRFLIYFSANHRPMSFFYTSLLFWCFQGIYEGNIGLEWLTNRSSADSINIWKHTAASILRGTLIWPQLHLRNSLRLSFLQKALHLCLHIILSKGEVYVLTCKHSGRPMSPRTASIASAWSARKSLYLFANPLNNKSTKWYKFIYCAIKMNLAKCEND